MNGDRVIARDFRGKPLVRRVWESTSQKVYICTDETYDLMLGGDTERHAVGFPRTDVFKYNASMVNELASNPTAWSRMTVWNTGGE